MIIDGSMLIVSDVWGEDMVQSDVWQDAEVGDDPENKTDQYTDYYLKQMNFLGNVL